LNSNKREEREGLPMRELPGKSRHILLVEDNEAHAELIIRGLREVLEPDSIHHVLDGEQALDYLFHRGVYASTETCPDPDLILLDLRLPRVDGLDVLRIVKETPGLLRTPVVVLTSSDAESDVARSYDYHANSYIVKPLEFRKLVQLMNDLGFYWLSGTIRR
jgi:CheY-like chemotaxis protein